MHKLNLWSEVQGVIASVDAGQCRTTISDENWTQEELTHSPRAMKRQFASLLNSRGWMECTVSDNVPRNVKLLRETFALPPADQEKATEPGAEIPIYGNTRTDFVNDRVAIEILPMRALQSEMSSGIAYYERELYNVVRQGRGVPAVPLVLIGVEP